MLSSHARDHTCSHVSSLFLASGQLHMLFPQPGALHLSSCPLKLTNPCLAFRSVLSYPPCLQEACSDTWYQDLVSCSLYVYPWHAYISLLAVLNTQHRFSLWTFPCLWTVSSFLCCSHHLMQCLAHNKPFANMWWMSKCPAGMKKTGACSLAKQASCFLYISSGLSQQMRSLFNQLVH